MLAGRKWGDEVDREGWMPGRGIEGGVNREEAGRGGAIGRRKPRVDISQGSGALPVGSGGKQVSPLAALT